MIGFCATLSNGKVINEWEIATEKRPGWLALQDYIKENNLQVTDLVLKFDHQRVTVRSHSRIYFYAKMVEAWLGIDRPSKMYYGVGAQHDKNTVEIVWYDGDNSKIEYRKINVEDKGFLFND